MTKKKTVKREKEEEEILLCNFLKTANIHRMSKSFETTNEQPSSPSSRISIDIGFLKLSYFFVMHKQMLSIYLFTMNEFTIKHCFLCHS